ncbi:MAG: hypothetical protein IKO09_06090 [Bacteroidales bacterium]|nr:hypothetical protein [Bacteroidales bacterium]
MDFDTILYILLMVAWLGFSVLKAVKKDDTSKKSSTRPISVETTEKKESGKSKKRETSPLFQDKPQEEEYFSYETMSDRDFAKEFGQADEEELVVTDVTPPPPAVHLTMDKESVFNGVIWSEILNRKY